MTTQGRRALQFAAGLALSGLFLWLALRGEDWGAIRAGLSGADYRYIVLMIPLGVYTLYARCQRWQILLEKTHQRRIPMMPIYSASAIGFMANMVLPFRVGEIARPYLVSRGAGLPVTPTMATVVVERVLDLVALAAFGVGIVLTSDVPAQVYTGAKWAAAIAGIGLLGIYIVVLRRDVLLPRFDRVWARIPKLGPAVLRLEHEFVDGMSAIADPWTLLRTVAWSFYIWFLVAVAFALGFKATGMQVPFIGGGVTVATIVALAVSVPSAPAFVGQFEWGCKVALQDVLGVPGSIAIGYALLVHATQVLTQVAVGVVFLAREGLTISDLTNMKDGPGDAR